MILFQNSLITIDYDPSTDIIVVRYPDLHTYLLPEIRNSINILVDTVKNYDVKRVLLDSSETVVAVSDEESKEIAHSLAAGLMNTRVQKVARVKSPVTEVEKNAQNNIKTVQAANSLPFQLMNFTSRLEAQNWLLA